MRHIEGQLPEEMSESLSSKNIAEAEGYIVPTFHKLVVLNASISYLNKDHMIFYRGQSSDYKNKAGRSTFYPTIYLSLIQI